MTDSKWLAGLQTGDVVAVTRPGCRAGYDISRVERRTPSGRILVRGVVCIFDACGREMGKRKGPWSGVRRELRQMTPAVHAVVMREEHVGLLRRTADDVNKLTDLQLAIIADTIRQVLGITETVATDMEQHTLPGGEPR